MWKTIFFQKLLNPGFRIYGSKWFIGALIMQKCHLPFMYMLVLSMENKCKAITVQSTGVQSLFGHKQKASCRTA